MSVCPKSSLNKKSKLDKQNYIKKYINTEVDIKQTIPFGFNSTIDKAGITDIYTHGRRNIEENLPFKPDSIYRMASQSKFMGSVGFLKLVDQNKINLDDPLKNYLPEYSSENMGVIKPYTPSSPLKTLIDPIYTTENSNIITINHRDHKLRSGDHISIEWSNGSLTPGKVVLPSVNGIPGFEVFNVFSIRVINQHSYEIRVSSPANTTGNSGGLVKIRKVKAGVKRSINFSPDTYLIVPKIKTLYYILETLKRELTVLDVLNHGLGWSYYASSILYMSFGYACDSIRRDIQSGIWNELGLPVGIPLSCYGCEIRDWVRLASNIPLLYQPGEDWSYGPQLSILGALIDVVDGRCVEKYMREELWEPLGMKDTGFFIRNREGHDYEGKKDRLAKLYVNMPKLVLKFMGDDILDKFPTVYEAQTCIYEGTQTLCLIDCGMYTTVNDYLLFMKFLLNDGVHNNQTILSKNMIDKIATYRTGYDVTNLATVSSYSSGLGSGFGNQNSEIHRKELLSNMSWGLGVGTIRGCKNMDYVQSYSDSENHGSETHNSKTHGLENNKLTITWAGVLGTRFLIDFCSGVAYNAGTNVIGPPAGTFDSDLIELNYKPMCEAEYNHILSHLLF